MLNFLSKCFGNRNAKGADTKFEMRRNQNTARKAEQRIHTDNVNDRDRGFEVTKTRESDVKK